MVRVRVGVGVRVRARAGARARVRVSVDDGLARALVEGPLADEVGRAADLVRV